nr:hypothetical protein [Tanacetum cinerariifolium]
MLLVVPVFLLVVLVHADGWVPTGSCTIPTGSYSFMLMDGFLLVVALFLLDDHNKVAYLEKGKGWEAYEQILDFLTKSHIRYALTHRPPIVFDSLIKQFWATAIVRTHEAGPSEISATIDGNEDGPHMLLLAPMLVVPTGGDGADAAAAGVAAANKVSSPLPPPDVPPTHTFSSTLGPSLAAHDTPEPTPDSPIPLSLLPYRRSEEVGPTTSTKTPSPTRQTSFQEDISEGGGDYVSSSKSNKTPPTTAATATGGAEDSAALTNLSIKLDRVKRLEGLLQQRKRRLVLFDSEGKKVATTEQDIDLAALHKLASMSLGGDTTVEAAYTIYKASQDAHASSDAGHNEDEVPDDTTMPFRPAAAAPSSTILAADKGKAPMLGQDLAKKLHAGQEAEFARQQEELAQKAQAKSVASPAEQGTGLSAQRRRDLDAAQLIYTEADWVPQDVHAASSQVPASVSAAPSTATAVSVLAAPSIHVDVSVSAAPSVHADIE